VGSVRNFRIEGEKLLADMEVLESYTHRAILEELVEKTPELFGLSAYFTAEYKVIDGKAYARIQKLNAVDVVDKGAVTPSGLFSAIAEPQISTPPNNVTTEEITALITAEIQKALAPLLEQLNAAKADASTKVETVAASAKEEVEKLRADVVALGVKFAAKPQDEAPAKPKTILDQWSELEGPARTAFFKKHEDEIWAARSAL
jgi:hypothetical protein